MAQSRLGTTHCQGYVLGVGSVSMLVSLVQLTEGHSRRGKKERRKEKEREQWTCTQNALIAGDKGRAEAAGSSNTCIARANARQASFTRSRLYSQALYTLHYSVCTVVIERKGLNILKRTIHCTILSSGL